MRTYTLLLFLFCFTLSVQTGYSQPTERDYPKDYFRPPLDLSPQASGSFGELRSNHFHSGTDYRTNQREGYPIYAVADGFISRARVQIGGGGNALYIDHPNGYTSVYMHLQKFGSPIAEHVKAKQYELESFAVDFFLEKDELTVKKGDIIAYSGNSGGSSGPHLHFEIRHTKTEETLNPQLFGLTIPDRVPPAISGFTVFRFGDAPFSENTPREHIQVTGSAGAYKLSTQRIIRINGNTGFGIVSTDQNSASANRNGVYSIELLLDGQVIFNAVFDGFFFHHSRALNSYIDYPTYIFKGQRIQKSFVEPGNPLTIYKNLINRGIIDIKDNKVHDMLYRVKDIKGNTSSLSFQVQYDPSLIVNQHLKKGTIVFPYQQVNRFKNDDIAIEIPALSLYSNLNFLYSAAPQRANGLSKVHAVHNRMIPLHNAYQLAIAPSRELSVFEQSKALILDTRGRSHGGIFENGYVKGLVREFGSFYIGLDTKAPVIRPLNISENKNMATVGRVNFKISDDLSGIHSFNGYINDKWILMEYDAKSASLWHVFEKDLPKGKHTFKLVVTDGKNNEKIYQVNFNK